MVEAQDEGSHPDLPGSVGHIVAYGIPRFLARVIAERHKVENLPGNGTDSVGADDVEHAVALNLLAESKGRVGNLLAALDNRPPQIHCLRIINLDRDAHALSPNHLGGEGLAEIPLTFEFGGHRESGKARILIADTFPGEEEEGLLFPLVKFGQPNRAAESSAVKVVMRQRFVTTCSIGLEQVSV